MLLYAREQFAADPWMVFQVWKGGMASHGGFLGVTLAGLWYARTRAVPFLAVGDLLCALAPAGLLILLVLAALSFDLSLAFQSTARFVLERASEFSLQQAAQQGGEALPGKHEWPILLGRSSAVAPQAAS